MNNFDLKKVHELIRFEDVCTSENGYMTKASSLPRVELETDALYVLTPKMPLLFTTKLRYYRLLVENEINRHINAATELLEADGSEELTKFVLKKTRESVTTLINEAKRLTRYNIGDKNWKNIISDSPSELGHPKGATELAVFSHYVIAELARCWLELQDRYAYVIGEGGCYDVSLFYTSVVGRNPDKEFEIRRLEINEKDNLQQLTEIPKLTTAAEYFSKLVAPFCFEKLPLVNALNAKQQAELIELMVKDACYAAAMLKYLGYYSRLRDVYLWKRNEDIIKHCAKALKCAQSTYKKYFYSLNSSTPTLTYERHNAQAFLDTGQIEKDYNRIKESK